ncbi:Flp pilus assembly protein TadB [Mycolicibacterium chubuense NBB4]|uniref:Flp pilus assembly protein TadB n=1 Tax=Mycolicibacterium chubuense (strain NBB4) TaxID=710421 RepID=I4BQA1_MYCCN|nr:type II secretion system F family protein [Mycolicibacterium chubuense]AFM19458.1 Flp pilus assembly protein TadB [Mycolicibacterium chubuense NBB4]
MIGAALALAFAVLVSPDTARARVTVLMPALGKRRAVPGTWCAVVVWAALALVVPVTGVLAAGVLGATVLSRRRLRRRASVRVAEAAALQGALDLLVAELRVGAHPVGAIEVAAAEADGQVAESLNAVAARALLGADVAAGLRAEAQRSTSPGHWNRLAECWELAQRHGLAIATLLQAAQRDIAERERFRGRVEAGMAGARATAAILAGLPALGVLLGHAIGAEPVRFLLSDGAGGGFLVVGTVLICCGLLWSDRITSRVLA